MGIDSFTQYNHINVHFKRLWRSLCKKKFVRSLKCSTTVCNVLFNAIRFNLIFCSCRLENPAYFYAFLFPICTIILANTVMLVKCLHKLHKTLKNNQRYTAEQKKSAPIAKAALGLSVLLGITWLLGIPTMLTKKPNFAFQYIFAIVNSFQGLAIFLFQVIPKKEMRQRWAEVLLRPNRTKPGDDNTMGMQGVYQPRRSAWTETE